jgi:hypothetical protein
MKKSLALGVFLFVLFASRSFAQSSPVPDPLDGVWQGYDGEWRHVSNQLIALAEATPEKNFAWRPGPGVRSTSEVYMHIIQANFFPAERNRTQDAQGDGIGRRGEEYYFEG